MKFGPELVSEAVAHFALVLPVHEQRHGLLHHLQKALAASSVSCMAEATSRLASAYSAGV